MSVAGTDVKLIFKMKKISIIIVTLLFSVTMQAQKVKAPKIDVSKDNKILVDGTEIATIEKDGCGFSATCTYYVRNSEGKTLITVMFLSFKDSREIKQSNPDGKVFYYRLSFADERGVAEVAYTTPSSKSVAKIIVKAKLIKDNELDDYEVRQFIQVHGTRYSDRQAGLNNRQQTIIINIR